jgi:phospholipid/cholesterol/gamma-HCH transport system permease protein
MGCIMTGIIVCGRTGAAFAAELGTMKVSEELDAFGTFAICSMEYLVLPRILALVIVTPVLCAFADLIAMFGGFTVSVCLLDVQPAQYVERTLQAATVGSLLLGLAKGAVFGFLVALMGCFRGMRCGTDAAAVGKATTSAVVSGITAIVVADGLFAVLCNTLGI